MLVVVVDVSQVECWPAFGGWLTACQFGLQLVGTSTGVGWEGAEQLRRPAGACTVAGHAALCWVAQLERTPE